MMKKYVRLFFRRISKDFKQKELLPVKFLFFIQMSTILVLYPYLTIHMRELGINVEETAIMSAVTPVVGILMPPIAGMLADKIGNFRILLATFSAIGGLSALLLLLVPIGRVKISYPETLVMGVSCTPNHPIDLIIPDDYQCARLSEGVINDVPLKIESCGFLCKSSIPLEDIKEINEYSMKYASRTKRAVTRSFYVAPEDLEFPTVGRNPENHQRIPINERYETAFRAFSSNLMYFPGRDFFNLNCDHNYIFGQHATGQRKTKFCEFTRGVISENSELQIGVGYLSNSTDEQTFEVEYINDGKEKFLPTCQSGFGSFLDEKITIVLHKENRKMYDISKCEPKCLATTTRKLLCKNSYRTVDKDVELTFWTYLAVRVFIGIIGGTSYTMFEGAVIAILREYKADYGLQRMYASIGGMISSPLSGWLIDYASRGKDYTDYQPVFFLYAVLKVISAGMMMFINLEFKTPSNSVISDVLSVLNIELISLFVAAFLLGSAWGYIESFLFWLLQDLGGSKSLMGLTITVGGIIGIPILVLSGPLIKRLGHANVIFIGFITYAVRLLGYSLIYNPWLALIFEAMECFTHSLCFTAAVTYAARLSTVTTDTTIQGIFGGLFYGVGKSFGSLVGGYLIKLVGMRQTFQIFAITTGITGMVYLAFYHFYMKKRSVLNKKEEEKPQEQQPNGESNVQVVENSGQNIGNDSHGANHDTENCVDKIKSVPYEDSLTNMAYEDTEGDFDDIVEYDPETTERIV